MSKMALARFSRDESGHAAMIFGLAALPAFMLVGMSMDYSRALSTQSAMQMALDASVVASRNEQAAQVSTVAQAMFASNYSATAIPAVASFEKNSGTVQGIASASVPVTFAGLFGVQNIGIQVKATATEDTSKLTTSPGGYPCMMVLDDDNSKSMNMISNSNLQAVNCEVHVRSNASADAFYSESASGVKFKKILVRGGAQGGSQIKDANGVVAVVANSNQVANDPFAVHMPSVTPAACTAANTNLVVAGIAMPGTYCGNTIFSGTTMMGGLYIFKDGTITIQGKTTGNGVSIYLANDNTSLSYKAGEGTVLTAPTSGTYRGILMFSAPYLNKRSVTISSVNKQSWTGLVYVPDWNLTLNSLSEWPKMNVALAVNTLKVVSLSTVIDPYIWTPWNENDPVTLPGPEIVTLVPGRLSE